MIFNKELIGFIGLLNEGSDRTYCERLITVWLRPSTLNHVVTVNRSLESPTGSPEARVYTENTS